MRDLIWLTPDQTDQISPCFPLSHGVPRVDDLSIVSGIIFVIRNGLRWRGGKRRVFPDVSGAPRVA